MRYGGNPRSFINLVTLLFARQRHPCSLAQLPSAGLIHGRKAIPIYFLNLKNIFYLFIVDEKGKLLCHRMCERSHDDLQKLISN